MGEKFLDIGDNIFIISSDDDVIYINEYKYSRVITFESE